MSQKEAHEALVERLAIDIGYGLHCGEGSPTLHSDIARAILAIVAEAVKEPTAEMREAGWKIRSPYSSGSLIYRAMLAASPLTPGDGG